MTTSDSGLCLQNNVLIKGYHSHKPQNTMNIKMKVPGIIAVLAFVLSCNNNPSKKNDAIYSVARLNQPLVIDGNWDKPQWQNIKSIDFNYHMEKLPAFRPSVLAKMMYDSENLYVIFRVEDRYVRCITKEINGPVYEDACVEFFFAPDTSLPERYFNLELNCGGTALMYYNIIPRKEFKNLGVEEIGQIEIAHSLPVIVDPEITEPVTWTIEYRLPLSILEKYSVVTHPEKGVSWKANFHKIAESNSNPHYLTWSFIDNPVHDFHLPQFFGTIIFE